MITSQFKYRLYHSFINNCISVDQIMMVSDDATGSVHYLEPHTRAFSPLDKDALTTWLGGNCPEYLEIMNTLWTPELIAAYSSVAEMQSSAA
jgi:hypothetical protein